MFPQCNAFISRRYAALDDGARAELKKDADIAKLEHTERQGDDSVCDVVRVRDVSKPAQLKAIEKAQREMAGLLQILQNHQLGVFIAYVPMNTDCAMQTPACDRNCDTLQAFFLAEDAAKTSSMLNRAKKYVKGSFYYCLDMLGVPG